MNGSPFCRLATVTPFTVGGFASDTNAMIADSENHMISGDGPAGRSRRAFP